MSHIGYLFADLLLRVINEEHIARGDGRYYHRMSAGGSRCPRDMVLHAMGEPWSDNPAHQYGSRIRFDQGHDAEHRLVTEYVKLLEPFGCHITGTQIELELKTHRGKRVTGHNDLVIVFEHNFSARLSEVFGAVLGSKYSELDGHWYLPDGKSADDYKYSTTYSDGDEPVIDPGYAKQLGQYANATLAKRQKDPQFEGLSHVRLRDLQFGESTFGGCIVIYQSLGKVKQGWGPQAVELPKLHATFFDPDDHCDLDALLDVYDDVDLHVEAGTLPPIPDPSDPIVWGKALYEGSGKNKRPAGYEAVRCQPRWCSRYSVCRGKSDPVTPAVRQAMTRER